jgi:hypothetical protein
MNNKNVLNDSLKWNWYQTLAWVYLRDYQYVEQFDSEEVYQSCLEYYQNQGDQDTEIKQEIDSMPKFHDGYEVERFLIAEYKAKISSGKNTTFRKNLIDQIIEIHNELKSENIIVWGQKVQLIAKRSLEKKHIEMLHLHNPDFPKELNPFYDKKVDKVKVGDEEDVCDSGNVEDTGGLEDAVSEVYFTDSHTRSNPIRLYNDPNYLLRRDGEPSKITVDDWSEIKIKYKNCLDCYIYSDNPKIGFSTIWEHPMFSREDVIFRWPPIRQTPKFNCISEKNKNKIINNNDVVSLREAFILNLNDFHPVNSRDRFEDKLSLKEHPLHLNFEKALKAIEDGELDIHDYSEGYYYVGLLDFMIWLAGKGIVDDLNVKDLIARSKGQEERSVKNKVSRWLITLMNEKNADGTFVAKMKRYDEYEREACETFGPIGPRAFREVWYKAQDKTQNFTWSKQGRIHGKKYKVDDQEND